jgi:uncharacterized protein (DUF1800 family)
MPADTPLTEEDAAHLLRRAGFGPQRREPARLAGRARSQAVQRMLDVRPSRSRPPAGKSSRNRDLERLQQWWLRRMRVRRTRLQEKMALFWHDHFPTSFAVVRNTRDHANQNALFRQYGLGSFRELVYRVTVDPAMLDYLDGRRNRVGSPNENYARELMELFTLGPIDENGVENYTQQDVMELARALTGFRVDSGPRRTVQLKEWKFDSGEKVLFEGRTFEARGNLGVEDPEGTPLPPERNVIDLLFTHRDSDGRPTLARFIARKLWGWFAYPAPELALIDELADVFVGSDYRIADLVFAILTHDEFYSDRARASTAKTPVDFALQALLGAGVSGRMADLPRDLSLMGMELFNPPGVDGWNHGEAWLSTSRYLARLDFAQRVAAGGSYRFDPRRIVDRRASGPDEICDALLARLQLRLSETTRQALIDYVGVPVDATDEDWLQTKLRGAFVLLLSLPEFQVH